MPYRAVGAAEMERVGARNRALLDKQFAHRNHFPFDLLPFGAEIIVFSGRRIGVDFRDFQSSAVHPGHRQVLVVWLPIIFERHDDSRRPPVEACRDIFLPVGNEVALGGLWIDGYMDTEAQARRLRDVLQYLHLSAVIPDAVDPEPLARCFDVGWNAVDHRILAALGTVDPFKTSPRVGTRKGAQVM